MAGKVSVGLASHRPCVTDFVVFSNYGLNGLGKRDEHPPTFRRGTAPFFPELVHVRLLQVRSVPRSRLLGIVVAKLLQASLCPTSNVKALKVGNSLQKV